MRVLKVLILPLCLILAVGLIAGCAGSSSAGAQQQVQAVTGDLALKINGSGKVTADSESKPQFGTSGLVESVLVKEGDSVQKGTVLASLETDNLELALSQAKVAQIQAQIALTQAQSAQTQADTSLTTAQFNLDRTQAVSDIKDSITGLQNQITAAQVNFAQATANQATQASSWAQTISDYQAQLALQQQKLAQLLSEPEYTGAVTYDILGQTYDRLTVEDVKLKQLQVQAAQLGQAQAAQTITQAQLSVDQATKAVVVAQKQLEDASITSPINGTVINVNIKEGDMVISSGLISAPSIYIYVIDPSSMQVTTQIDEVDITGVKIGQKAIFNLDSMPGVSFAGIVKSIGLAPSADVQSSGVVVYDVKVGFVNPIPPEVKLGMSATVDIIAQERTGAILIPSRAIQEDDAGNKFVDVMVNQKIEKRTVQTGITDGISTEIISGLSAGDTVVITRATVSSSLFGQ